MKPNPETNPFVEFLIEDLENGKTFYNLCTKTIASKFGIGREDARDIYQNLFTRIIEYQPTLNPEKGTIMQYLNRAIRSHYLDFLRKKNRTPTQNSTSVIKSRILSPLEILTKQEEAQQLYKMIKKFPLHMKEITELRISGMSYEQMAIRLKVPIGTVKSRLNRSKKTLAKLLNLYMQ